MKSLKKLLKTETQSITEERKSKKRSDLASSKEDESLSVDAEDLEDDEDGGEEEDRAAELDNMGISREGGVGTTRKKKTRSTKNTNTKQEAVAKFQKLEKSVKNGETPLGGESGVREMLKSHSKNAEVQKIGSRILDLIKNKKVESKDSGSNSRVEKGLTSLSNQVSSKGLVPIRTSKDISEKMSKGDKAFDSKSFIDNFDNFASKKMNGKQFLKSVFPKIDTNSITNPPAVVSNMFKAIVDAADKDPNNKGLVSLRKAVGEDKFERVLEFARKEAPKNLEGVKNIYKYLEDGKNLKGDGPAPVVASKEKKAENQISKKVEDEKEESNKTSDIDSIKNNSGIEEKKPEEKTEKNQQSNDLQKLSSSWNSSNPKISKGPLKNVLSQWEKGQISSDDILDSFEGESFFEFAKKVKESKDPKINSSLDVISAGGNPSELEAKAKTDDSKVAEKQPEAEAAETAEKQPEAEAAETAEKQPEAEAAEKTKPSVGSEEESDEEESDEEESDEEESDEEESKTKAPDTKKDAASEYHEKVKSDLDQLKNRINNMSQSIESIKDVGMRFKVNKVNKDFNNSSKSIEKILEKSSKLLTDFPTENSIREANRLIQKAAREFSTINTVYGSQIDTLEKRIEATGESREKEQEKKDQNKDLANKDILSKRGSEITREEELVKQLGAKLGSEELSQQDRKKIEGDLDVAKSRLERLQKVGVVDRSLRKAEKVAKGSSLYRPAAKIADSIKRATSRIGEKAAPKAEEAMSKVKQAVNQKINNTAQQPQQPKAQQQQQPKVQSEEEAKEKLEAEKRARAAAEQTANTPVKEVNAETLSNEQAKKAMARFGIKRS